MFPNLPQGLLTGGGGGAIATAVEQIACPVTGICPCLENLKLYVNCVPCDLLFVKVRYLHTLVW